MKNYFIKLFYVYRYLLSNKINSFDSDNFWTIFWYKYAGWMANNNINSYRVGDLQFNKQFNWRRFDYGLLEFMGCRGIRIISVVYIILISFYFQKPIFLVTLLSPLYLDYFLIEIKPEVPYLILLFLGVTVLYSNQSWGMILILLSTYNVTTAVFSLQAGALIIANKQEYILWGVALALCIIISLSTLVTNIKIFKKTAVDLGNTKIQIKRPTKAALFSLVLIVYMFNQSEDYILLIAAISIITNQIIFRFLDASTERRLLVLSVLYYACNYSIEAMLILFIPFRFISCTPKFDLNGAEKNVKQWERIVQIFNRYEMKINKSPLLFWYTGEYSMNNRIRFLWPAIEYISKNIRHILPNNSIFTDPSCRNWLENYKMMEFFNNNELSIFLKEYKLIIAPIYLEKRLKDLNYQIYETLTNDWMEINYTNGVKLAIFRKE